MIEDFILCDEGHMPKDTCDAIINDFELNIEWHEDGVFGRGKIDHRYKKCTEVYLTEEIAPKLFEVVGDYAISSVKKYQREYHSVDMLDAWGLFPEFKIQRYRPGEGYFAEHSEHSKMNHNRVLAWMIYLNDVYDGGYTEFPNQKKKFQPRVGDTLIWPAYFTHSHRGVTSQTETKYIATGWFDYL